MMLHPAVPAPVRRPLDALGDLPGDPGYDLTRAVIVFRPTHHLWEEKPSDRDWGLGLVLDGSYPMAADVIDLGSGRRYLLDLERLVTVIDWVAAETLQHVARLLGEAGAGSTATGTAGLFGYAESLGLEVLRRAGVDPLTRGPLLRIGFRDIVRDVEMGDDADVRIGSPGKVARIELDAEAMMLRVTETGALPGLDGALAQAFQGHDVRAAGRGEHHVRLAIPTTYLEMEALLRVVRRGVLHLLAVYEPERHQAATQVTRALGSRSTLYRLFGSRDAGRAGFGRLDETA